MNDTVRLALDGVKKLTSRRLFVAIYLGVSFMSQIIFVVAFFLGFSFENAAIIAYVAAISFGLLPALISTNE